jgi:putative flavoprotein involved in K+ transport
MNDAIIIGAGQAGLTAGYHLKQANLNHQILEAGPEPSGSWPHYYDSLKLFSPARFSSLPGTPFPGSPDGFPTRDEVIAYLKHFAQTHHLPVQTNQAVQSVQATPNGFTLETRDGQHHQARAVISATGAFHTPYLPTLPNQDAFQGRILHASAYKTPEEFAKQRIVVVGSGNSAVQIAVELAQTTEVTLAVREPIQFAPRRILGLDFHVFLQLIDRLALGHLFDLSVAKQVWDFGEYKQAIQAGKPAQKSMFKTFIPDGVQWADDRSERIDSVIFATGYTHSLPYLTDTLALNQDGKPLHRHGISTSVPGLYYLGLAGQRTVSSAALRGVDADARVILKHLNSYLRITSSRTDPSSDWQSA